MKRVFVVLLVCGLLAAVWLFYSQSGRHLLDRITSSPSMADIDRIIDEDIQTPFPESFPKAASEKSVTRPVNVPNSTMPVPAAPKSEVETLLETRYPMPRILPLLTIVDQWRNVPPNAYPPEVTAKETIAFELVINGQVAGSSKVAPGTPLKPVSLIGDQLAIASLADPTMQTQLPVDKTDFKERIEARYNQFVALKTEEIEKKRARARQIITSDPSRMAALTGKAPVVTMEPGTDSRFASVKDSLRKGQVESLRLEEAIGYHWNGAEEIGGKYAGTYDTVTVQFEVVTIFGRFPTEYKALLKGNQVVLWIDPVTEDRL